MRNDFPMTEEIWEQLFPELYEVPEKVDYSISPEERIKKNTIQLYDTNGFAVMEDIYNLEPEEWLNIETEGNAFEKSRPEVKQLLADNGWEIEGVMPTWLKEKYYRKFRENPYWFMTKDEIIDYNIDCNFDLASAYLKYPFIHKHVYSTDDDLKEAIAYRKKKLFESPEVKDLGILGMTEVIRELAEQSYLHKDTNANKNLNYNMKVYGRALEKAGLGYLVNSRKFAVEQARDEYFDDILSNDSYGGYSRLKELELMMRATNRAMYNSDEVIREQSENMIAQFLAKPSVGYDNMIKDITSKYMDMGLPIPDKYVYGKESKEFLLSELEDEDPVITAERKKKAEMEAQKEQEEIEERRQVYLFEKNRPRTLQELIGVDYDYDNPESIEKARKTYVDLMSKKKIEWQLHEDGRFERYMPPEEYLTSEQLKEWYPERYQELVESNKIYPAYSDIMAEIEEEREALEKYKKNGGVLDYTLTTKTIKKNSVEEELEKNILNEEYYGKNTKEAIEYRSGVDYNDVMDLYDILNDGDNEDDERDVDFEEEKRKIMGDEAYDEEINKKKKSPKGRVIPGIGTENIPIEVIEEAYVNTRNGIILENLKARERMLEVRTDRDPNAIGFAGNPYPMDPFEEDDANKEEYKYYSEERLADESYKDVKYLSMMKAGLPAEAVYDIMKKEDKERIIKTVTDYNNPNRLDEDASKEDIIADNKAFNDYIKEHENDIPAVEEHAQQVIKYLKREYELSGLEQEPRSVLSEIVSKRKNRI